MWYRSATGAALIVVLFAGGGCVGTAPQATVPPATTAPPPPTATQIRATDTPTSTLTPQATAEEIAVPPTASVLNGAIAFYSERDGNAEIYVMNPDGSSQQRLTTDDADDVCPDWSPDGTQIVFATARHDPDPSGCFPHCRYEIYTMRTDGSGLSRLTDTPDTEIHPAWSPDGAHIAFVSDRDGNQEIYVMKADGSDPVRLTDNPAADMRPTWSPDGLQIAFNSDRDGDWDIYAMSSAGGEPHRLTDSSAWELFPDWSPDGRQIAFFSMQQGASKQDIYAMDADGSNIRRLTDRPRSVDEDPVWSPDGAQIAFQSDRDGHFDIYVMEADGSDQRPLTEASSQEYWPAWSSAQMAATVVVEAEVPSTSSQPPRTDKPSPTMTPVPPTATPVPTNTPPEPSATPTPTGTPIPPTPTPLGPTPTPQPATHTVCAQGCDYTTLQDAIDDVAVDAGAVIQVMDPMHTEAGVVVNKDVTIRGLGAGETTVQGHEESAKEAPERVFLVERGRNVVLADMTIRHGKPSVSDEHGGGIKNSGTLTVRDCTVRYNVADGGGGLVNYGTLTLVNSTVSNNTAEGVARPPGIWCGGGGGIKCGKGTLTVINSTISGNRAGIRERGWGGGVHVGCGCEAEFVNSTISGNKSVSDSGGVRVRGTLKLVNCTITDNTAKGEGGGLYVVGQLDYMNSIMANNRGKGGDCVVDSSYGFTFQGEGSTGMSSRSLVGSGNCPADLSADPVLGPLADNGGPTLTHALLPGSPAIDAIAAAGCSLAIDQRGAPRPAVRTSVDTPCDIGAFELEAD
jgi:TolB protein